MPGVNSNGVDEDAVIGEVLSRHESDPTRLMQILREIQERIDWLSPGTLTKVAEGTRLPRGRVEGVAGFYHFFHTEPLGRYRVLWSDNITDRMAGNADLMARMCKKLWLKPGRVSEDGLVSVDTTSCTGLCDQGPALLVNYRPVTRMTPERVDQIVELIRHKTPVAEWPAEFFKVEDNIRRKDALLGADFQPGDALKALKSPQEVLDAVRESGLRGRGGAGFSTGQKWEFCRAAVGTGAHPTHYVVCNADEGEPGTFKDRWFLEHHAARVLEGTLIAAWAVEADEAYVYLRDEYADLHETLGGLIRDLPGDVPVHLRRGAGAYVCGEESALIESLEGKRGLPRQRPPYVAEVGLFGRPTLVNNVETLYWVSRILDEGAELFTFEGRNGHQGLRTYSVSGRVREPGVKIAPNGITVTELIDEFCGGMEDGHTLAAYLPGGASGGFLPAHIRPPLAFGAIEEHGGFIGSAAVVVFSQADDLRAAALGLARFFAHESCGQCTPCRVGTAKSVDLLARPAWDAQLLDDLASVMRDASICGLGQAAPNVWQSLLRHFPEVVK